MFFHINKNYTQLFDLDMGRVGHILDSFTQKQAFIDNLQWPRENPNCCTYREDQGINAHLRSYKFTLFLLSTSLQAYVLFIITFTLLFQFE